MQKESYVIRNMGGNCMLGVTCQECNSQRFLDSYFPSGIEIFTSLDLYEDLCNCNYS